YAFYDAAERAAVPTPPEERPIILIEHALTGDGNAADWWADMVGVGKPIDTAKYLVLCANALGGCAGSTGPSSLHQRVASGGPVSQGCPSATSCRPKNSCWMCWRSRGST